MIVDEFLWIAKSALRGREGLDTIRVVAVRPSTRGPEICYEYGEIGRAPPTSFGAVPPRPTPAEILECVARTLRLRWRHGTPKALSPADEGWRAEIEVSHPGIFEPGGPASWSGWRFLWHAGAEWIDEVGRPPDWVTTQTKEKFGTIRWYVQGSLNDKHGSIIRCVEIVSGYTCEYCGAPGRLRKGGWAKTTCGAHAYGKEAVPYDDDD